MGWGRPGRTQQPALIAPAGPRFRRQAWPRSVALSRNACYHRSMKLAGLYFATALALAAQPVLRFPENPLITQEMSPALGDDINGPSVIRAPSWIEHPLGRYYLYFAHHKGAFIRMAYADNLKGPWKIYAPGVLDVKDSAF